MEMKNMWSDSETFEAYATIDCCYFMISKLKEGLNETKPTNDELIGFANGANGTEFSKTVDAFIHLLKQIISFKKKINADYSVDSKTLKELRIFKKKLMNQIPLTKVTGSSTVAARGYDKESATMRIEYHSTGLYDYYETSKEEYASIVKAESVGSQLRAVIKGKRFKKV